MSAAFAMLAAPPTSAAVVVDPVEETGTGLAGWYPASRFTGTDLVERLVSAYSTSIGTRHQAVGAACGLQGYAGRVAVAALGLWVQTGALPDLGHDAWHVQLDAEGRATAVAPPLDGAVPTPGATTAAEALVGDHLAPVIRSFREVGRITERLALGCVAASCASVFARLHRRVPAEGRGRVEQLAQDFLTAPVWSGAGRRLVSMERVEVRTGPALVTERHTCCLMRLGDGRRPCGTCSDITAEERQRRTRHHATFAPRGNDLQVVTVDVA